MGLNSRPSMDWRWALHHRSVPVGWQVATVLIARKDGTEAVWDPATGSVTGGALETVYYGKARLQPNKDWRARRRNGENSPMVQNAVRIQLGMECPPVLFGDFVRVFDAPFDDSLLRYIFHIRTSIQSSNTWGRSVLGDADLTENAVLHTQLADLAALAQASQ